MLAPVAAAVAGMTGYIAVRDAAGDVHIVAYEK
jgi:hypothetical protein